VLPQDTATQCARAGRASRVLAALVAVSLVAGLAAAAPAGAEGTSAPVLRATSHATSQNWAGYAVTAGSPFHRVLGSWVQPTPHCLRGSANYAAFWIGIGGFTQSSRGLEQIGTDSDCSAGGRASYYAWYELLPAPPVLVPLRLRPGDEVSASVTMNGSGAALHFRDLTTHRAFIKSVGVRQPDSSSAEWIAEAPSECAGNGFCRTLPLDDFGSVTFSDAQAQTADGELDPVGDPEFLATELELDDRPGPSGRSGSQVVAGGSGRASTSPLSADGSAFSVFWEAAQAARARTAARGAGSVR